MGGRGNNGGHEKSHGVGTVYGEKKNPDQHAGCGGAVARVILNEDQFRTRAPSRDSPKDIIDVAGLVASSEQVTLSTSYFWDALTRRDQKLIYLGKPAVIASRFEAKVAIPVGARSSR
jgi:hypothetical protein